MIYLIEMKPGEAKSFAGRFRLTGVVMVDPHDGKTMQLPLVKNVGMKRSLLLLDLWRRDVAVQRGDGETVVWSNSLARVSLHALGGLMGVW